MNGFSKRFFDLLFSSSILLVGFPIFFLIALAIRCTSRGPVFYSCWRIGKHGQRFRCWKFRTMHPEAEVLLPSLLSNNPGYLSEWNLFFKLKSDPRVTYVGKWLRKTSFDELPQFWNVLRGEMSVVGPRPLTEFEVSKYLGDRQKKILSMRPGMTNIWVISGRNDLSYEERIRLEELYVDRHSLRLDLRIIIKTIYIIFSQNGAY